MLCKKILNSRKTGFGILSLVFVLGLFFSVFFATDTFAVNYSYSFTQGSSSETHLCLSYQSGDTPLCSDIKSVIISSTSNSFSIRPNLTYSSDCSVSSGSTNLSVYFYSPFSSFIYTPISGQFCSLTFGSSYQWQNAPSGTVVDFVLSTDEPFSSSSPSLPSGTLNISQNGTYDVSSYASAEVDVPPVMGDYHDDLVNIQHAILVCGAILLVIYFFYCIYRMIIKSTGGQ